MKLISLCFVSLMAACQIASGAELMLFANKPGSGAHNGIKLTAAYTVQPDSKSLAISKLQENMQGGWFVSGTLTLAAKYMKGMDGRMAKWITTTINSGQPEVNYRIGDWVAEEEPMKGALRSHYDDFFLRDAQLYIEWDPRTGQGRTESNVPRLEQWLSGILSPTAVLSPPKN